MNRITELTSEKHDQSDSTEVCPRCGGVTELGDWNVVMGTCEGCVDDVAGKQLD